MASSATTTTDHNTQLAAMAHSTTLQLSAGSCQQTTLPSRWHWHSWPGFSTLRQAAGTLLSLLGSSACGAGVPFGLMAPLKTVHFGLNPIVVRY